MIFQHTWEKVLSGEKTQTRRIVKPDDLWTRALSVVVIGRNAGSVLESLPRRDTEGAVGIASVQSGSNYPKYKIGKTYAVQSGRGQKAVARIRILSIRREDVREISDEDVIAEGFNDVLEFWKVWCSMHDKEAAKYLPEKINHASLLTNKHGIRDLLHIYPAERYDAWALTFEVVK